MTQLGSRQWPTNVDLVIAGDAHSTVEGTQLADHAKTIALGFVPHSDLLSLVKHSLCSPCPEEVSCWFTRLDWPPTNKGH